MALENTILITGGAGYIGSRFVRDLAEDPAFAGATIRIADNMQRERFESLADLPDGANFEFIEADLMDPASMRLALDGVSAVVHLAALVRTPFSFDYPAWTEHVNHWGTARLIEHALEAGVGRFVFASSASVYGLGGPFAEDARCAPVGPYSHSKLRAEDVVRAAGRRGLAATILRLGIVYGDAPGIRFDGVPNRLAYLAAIGRSIPLHGTGEQIRPIVHVRDASSSIRFALSHPETVGETYNVLGGNASIASMVDVVRRLRPFVRIRSTAQDELTRFSLALDGRKLEKAGWRAALSLEEGFAEILQRFGRFRSALERTEAWMES